MKFLIKVLQGSLIGLGAVLPGISGGVLCVIFGIYKTIMELFADPFRNFKTHVPKLIPVVIGGAIGFLGIANILSVLLERYPAPSVCLFIGLITGMLPSLFREAGEQGKGRNSYVSMYVAMAVTFILLVCLKVFSVEITPNFGWYIFCGFCRFQRKFSRKNRKTYAFTTAGFFCIMRKMRYCTHLVLDSPTGNRQKSLIFD